MLNIQSLDVYRGSTHVLHDISLQIGRGESVALIGANGAGKTSTLRTISGLLSPRGGTITYRPSPDADPLALHNMKTEDIVAAGVSHCPEGRGVFSQLSVLENLNIGAFLRNDNEGIKRDLDQILTLFPILAERRGQAAGSLSGGEQMMLAVGRALMSRPKLLMLDEPSLGLAPLIVEQIFKLLQEVNETGVTILLVEQNAVMALEFADRAYVIETGRVVMEGPSNELANDDNVRKAYLGG
ncbi:ABC transporter ATP-binding protein [Desulfovibrio sp. Fe33]|uniref:ABC transporter ATP-binding protein n=1 Tax=Desulfovibrio sp. Fe33 TaxID=3020842 RepID=UPI00234D986A|nr:ABC transporter ATP-binding protein [Desulfovibrio sp. Fe33]